jgi:DNA-binding transcriptional regulator of glucitol operon
MGCRLRGAALRWTTYFWRVRRSYRFALRPGWIVFHLCTVAAAITMILLGRWQLHVSESKHFSLQNFGYSIQWWLFSAFAVFFWWRILRDSARRRAEEADPTTTGPARAASEPVAYRRYVMPTTPQPTDDPTLTAYNDYLASLAARDAEDKP